MQSNTKIDSKQKSNYKFVLLFGIMLVLLSVPFFMPSVSSVVFEGDSPDSMMFYLFPLIGIGSLFFGWNMRKNFLHFGRTPLVPLPEVGQVGGQVGGRIELNQYYAQHDLLVTLNCMNEYTTRDTSERSTLNYQVLWKDEITPLYYKSSTGSLIGFCFDVPAGEYTKDTYKGRGRVYWEVCVEGLMGGVKFDRRWIVPVEEGNQVSSIVITDRHKEISANERNKKAEVAIEQQIITTKTGNALNILSEKGYNQTANFLFLIMGVAFVFSGNLFDEGYDLLAIIFDYIFITVGCAFLCVGIFLLARTLECKIIGTTVYTQRRLFGCPIGRSDGQLTSPEELSLEVTMSMTMNGKLIETMALYANVNRPVSKKIKLVEGIKGRAAGEAMQKKIVKAVFR